MRIFVWTKKKARAVAREGPCVSYCNQASCEKCYDYETACRVLVGEI